MDKVSDPREGHPRGGLRTALVLGLPLVGLFLIAATIAAAIFLTNKERLLAQHTEHQLDYAAAIASNIDTHLQDRRRFLRLVSTLPSVQQQDVAKLPSELSAFLRAVDDSEVQGLRLYNANGEVFWSTDSAAVGEKCQDCDFIAWARKPKNRRSFISQTWERTPEQTQQSHGGNQQRQIISRLRLITPIYRGAAGDMPGGFAGVASLNMDLDAMLRSQTVLDVPDKDAHSVWIVDDAGTLLFHSEHPEMTRRNVVDTDSSCTECHASFGYVETMLSSRYGTTRYRLKGREQRIGAYTSVDLDNQTWVVVANARLSEMTALFNQSFQLTLALVGVVLLCAIFGAFHTLRFYRAQERAEAEARLLREKQVLEEKLGQAQRAEAVGRLAGGLAHDINNNLTAIRCCTELLMGEVGDNADARQDLMEINRVIERSAGLIRQLLAFSRRQVMHPQVLNLNEQVDEVAGMLKRILGKEVDLSTTLATRLGQVRADPSQIEQVLVNLVVNARDAMPEGGKLIIETHNAILDQDTVSTRPYVEPGHYIMLAVSDTGSGMTDEVKDHLFEPFFTTKEVGKGTGLGLATVYGIVKQSHGYIWVDSELEIGSTFRVYLPRIDVVPEPNLKPELKLGWVPGV